MAPGVPYDSEMGRHLIRATLVASGAVGAAFAMLQVALPSTGGAGTYATSSAAVALAAAVAGVAAGLLAVAFSALVVSYAHLPPLEAWHIEQAADLVGLGLFVVNGIVVAIVIAHLRGRRPSTARPVRGVGETVAPRAAPAKVPERHDGGLVEPLTERELEVLGLLAEGMSNEAIATSLCLSVNTVKTHLKNVYGKLEVNNRTQAVARSQALGIIGIIDGRHALAIGSGERTAA
jgi:DNA-binding CsgD family transcriptional regulator